MRHKHADLIHAWAEGADIQRYEYGMWVDTDCPRFRKDIEYRIKPEKKPDEVRLFYFDGYRGGVIQECQKTNGCDDKHDLKLTFDGETGKLIKAEVL